MSPLLLMPIMAFALGAVVGLLLGVHEGRFFGYLDALDALGRVVEDDEPDPNPPGNLRLITTAKGDTERAPFDWNAEAVSA